MTLLSPSYCQQFSRQSQNVDEQDDRNDFEGENEHDNVEIIREDDIPNDGLIFDLFDMWLL